MNDYLLLYLWAISGGVKVALAGFIAISVFAFVISGIYTCVCLDDKGEAREDGSFKIGSIFTAMFMLNIFVLTALNVLIPSKQDLALIWALPQVKGGIEQAILDKDVQDISKNVLDITKLKLKNIKEDLQKENVEVADKDVQSK